MYQEKGYILQNMSNTPTHNQIIEQGIKEQLSTHQQKIKYISKNNHKEHFPASQKIDQTKRKWIKMQKQPEKTARTSKQAEFEVWTSQSWRGLRGRAQSLHCRHSWSVQDCFKHFNSALELQQDTGLVWMAQRLKHKVKTRATQTHMPQSCCGEKQSCGVDYQGLFHFLHFLVSLLSLFLSSSLPSLFIRFIAFILLFLASLCVCLLLPSDPPSFLPSFFPSSLIPSFCSCGFNFPRCSQKCFFDPPKVLIDPQKIFDTYPQIINGWITTKLTPSNVPKHQSTSIPPRCFLCPPHVSRSVPGRSSPLRLPRHRPQRWCVSAVGRRPGGLHSRPWRKHASQAVIQSGLVKEMENLDR